MHIPGRRIDADEQVITKPFGRGGDGLFLRAQLVSKESTASGEVTIEVQTRNSEGTWGVSPSVTLASTLTISVGSGAAGDVFEMLFEPTATDGILEELRLKVSGTAFTTPTAGSGWALIRVFEPLFYDTASS